MFFNFFVISILVQLALMAPRFRDGWRSADGWISPFRSPCDVLYGCDHPVGVVNNQKHVFLFAGNDLALFVAQSTPVKIQEIDTGRLRLLFKG